MPQKTSATPEEKIIAVESYLGCKVSQNELARIHSVRLATIQDWIRIYKTRGTIGFSPTTNTKKYPPELKHHAVEDYLSGVASQNDICAKYNISARSMLQKWILCYNSHGEFKQQSSEGAIYMAKGRKTTLDERIEIVGYCISNNKDYGKTINKYGVSYQQVYGWVKKYELDGIDGLDDKRGKRKTESSMSEVEKLQAQIKLKDAENLRLQMENELLKKLEALERGQSID